MSKTVTTSLIFVFLIASLNAFALNKDSLEALLLTDIPDSSKIEILGSLSSSNLANDPDQAIAYAFDAAELAERSDDAKRLGYALKNVGLGYYYKGDFVKVLEHWEGSLKAFESINFSKGIANLLSNIGAVYYSTGDNTKAIEYYLRAIRIAEESGDDFRLATVLQNIGAVYENTQEFDKAEKYLLEALVMFEKLEYDKGIGTTSLNLGEIYFQQKQLDKAAEYFEKSKINFEKTDDNFLPTSLIMMGKLDSEKKNYSKAIRDLLKAYDMAVSKDGKVAMGLAQNALGDVYLKMGNPNKAIKAFSDAEKIGRGIGVNDDLQHSYSGLIEAYKLKKDFANVSQYQDSLLSTNKAIYDIEKNKKLSNLQLSYNIEKKESEIAMLNADNEIKSQQIARANLLRNFFLASAIFLLVLASGAIYLYRYAKKTNKIITGERNKSNQLLLNILPEETAEELKKNGSVKAKKYDYATVLFTDFVDFTGKAEKIDPEDLVKGIDYYFRNFDRIIQNHNLEKIKTIGDAYMCVGGLPKENSRNAIDAVNAAYDIIQFVEETALNPPPDIPIFKIRIGINCGPLVAGVVGTTKFQYDIWGDTVNVASRMETLCEPNHVNVSENVFNVLKDEQKFIYRGEIAVKNRGEMKMYYLDRAQAS